MATPASRRHTTLITGIQSHHYGALLNRRLPRPSEVEALAVDGAALGPLDGAPFAARHALHLDLEGPLFGK